MYLYYFLTSKLIHDDKIPNIKNGGFEMISTKQASEMGEKLILYVIGIGAFITALVDIFNAISSYSIQLEQLFTLFIYAEIIGMVGAYTSSSRIPVTLPIIIAITALCRLIVMHGKDMEALVLLGESGSILLLSGAAYVMSLKGKLSLEKKDSFEKN